jgi:hypothetical protein
MEILSSLPGKQLREDLELLCILDAVRIAADRCAAIVGRDEMYEFALVR